MKRYLLFLSFICLAFSPLIVSQSLVFSDDFDQYTAGEKLACQNDTDWTTWSDAPCGTEDALVDSTRYFSMSRSILILPDNDLVKQIDNLTDGSYSIAFKFYIAAGKSGYFNVLQLFSGNNSEWAFEAFFNADGTGYINAGGENSATFTYSQGVWDSLEVRADMADTNDTGSFYLGDSLVYTWVWSTGATGTGTLKQIGGVDFYGGEATNSMYVDDFQIRNNGGVTSVGEPGVVPAEFTLDQNYPNPFNPSTRIRFSIPEATDINFTVYNELGELVSVIKQGFTEAGTHEITFDAKGLPSGIYIYKLQSGSNTLTRKMILLK